MVWLLQYELYIHTVLYIFSLLLLAVWETRHTWRKWMLTARRTRWERHVSIMVLDQLVVRLVFPIMPVGVAVVIAKESMGLLNQSEYPFYLHVILGILLLDILMYWQHKILHKYRWLWRFHQVHHMDREIDVTTGLRFHPIEMIFTVSAKIMGVGLLGIPPIGVMLYEILYAFATLFTHTNVKLAISVEQKWRYIIVTPDMHRIHHSDVPEEMNKNFGFCLSVWDKLFGTYQAYSRTGPRGLVMGLEHYRHPQYNTVENMLWVPFNIKRLRQRSTKPPVLQFAQEQAVLLPIRR